MHVKNSKIIFFFMSQKKNQFPCANTQKTIISGQKQFKIGSELRILAQYQYNLKVPGTLSKSGWLSQEDCCKLTVPTEISQLNKFFKSLIWANLGCNQYKSLKLIHIGIFTNLLQFTNVFFLCFNLKIIPNFACNAKVRLAKL